MNSPKEVAQNYSATGVAKTKYTVTKMLVLSILAGMFIGLAGVGSTMAAASIASASVAKLVMALVFPVGLIMVLIAGSELFTGNCLIVISVMEKDVKLRAMFKNWIIVYIGNFIGSIIIALLTVYSGTFSAFSNAAAALLIKTAVTKVGLSFSDALLRGILCNFLVCIGVWMSYAAKDVLNKIMAAFLPVMLFVASGYEHSIANMLYLPAALFAKGNSAYVDAYAKLAGANHIDTLTWGALFVKNLSPVTLGNIIGGTVLVGMVYWFVYLYKSGEKEKH